MKFLASICSLFLTFSVFCQDTQTISFQIDTSFETEPASIDVFKGYISNIELTFEDGNRYTDSNGYYLINFLDPSTTSIEISTGITKKISSISYLLGTDSLINVSGVYSGDLDPILGMYWAWNSGYINWKLEGNFKGEDFTYHVGGYAYPNPTMQRISHEVNQNATEKIVITIELIQFLRSIDFSANSMIMSPRKEAVNLANSFVQYFSIRE